MLAIYWLTDDRTWEANVTQGIVLSGGHLIVITTIDDLPSLPGDLLVWTAQHLDPEVFARLVARGHRVVPLTRRGQVQLRIGGRGQFPPMHLLLTIDPEEAAIIIPRLVQRWERDMAEWLEARTVRE